MAFGASQKIGGTIFTFLQSAWPLVFSAKIIKNSLYVYIHQLIHTQIHAYTYTLHIYNSIQRVL